MSRSTAFRQYYPGLLRRYLSSSVMRNTSTDSKKTVDVDKMGKITLIGINRPEKKNIIDQQTLKLLFSSLQTFQDDEEALVAVLHGKGGSFCSGYNVDGTQPVCSQEDGHIAGLMEAARKRLSKPVIAAVSGFAVGAGFELVLMCDLRVVEETAVMGVFGRKSGQPMMNGGTTRLPQLIGLSRALDLILTGRPISGKEALEFGLANRLVSTGTALGQSVQLAKHIAVFPPLCLRADLCSTYYAAYEATSLLDALQNEFKNGWKVLVKESTSASK